VKLLRNPPAGSMPEQVFQEIHAAISEAMRRFILKKSGQFTAEEGLDLFLTREDRQAIARVREVGGEFHEDLSTRFIVEPEAGARIEFALGWNRWGYRILPCRAHASPIIADILRDPNRHHNRELAARVVRVIREQVEALRPWHAALASLRAMRDFAREPAHLRYYLPWLEQIAVSWRNHNDDQEKCWTDFAKCGAPTTFLLMTQEQRNFLAEGKGAVAMLGLLPEVRVELPDDYMTISVLEAPVNSPF
jgi:hypothetical protein